LITWGIVIYNLNCDRTNKSFLIQRSKSLILAKTLKQKIELLKQYYIRFKDGDFDHRHRNSIFYEQLVNLIFNNEKKNAYFSEIDT